MRRHVEGGVPRTRCIDASRIDEASGEQIVSHLGCNAQFVVAHPLAPLPLPSQRPLPPLRCLPSGAGLECKT